MSANNSPPRQHPRDTMKEVISRLREESAPAMIELGELDRALVELAANAEAHARGLQRAHRNLQRLLSTPVLSDDAVRVLLQSSRLSAQAAEGVAAAVREIRVGLDAWEIIEPLPDTEP